jgi:hypothetical protein
MEQVVAILKSTILKFILLLAVLISQAHADISSVSGTFSDGSSISISGSGFDVVPSAANGNLIIVDNFEGGTVGNSIYTTDNPLVGGYDGQGSNYMEFYNGYVYSGSQAAAFTVGAGSNDSGSNSVTLYTNISATTKFFQSYWVGVPSGESFPGTGHAQGINWKSNWITVGGNPVGGPDAIFAVWLSDPGAFYGGGDCAEDWTSTWTGGAKVAPGTMIGTWTRYFGVQQCSDSIGWVKVWNNYSNAAPTLRVDLSGADNACGTGQCGYTRVGIGDYCRHNASGSSHGCFDDYYFAVGSNAAARVEIHNASTWATSTKTSICYATGSPTTSSITCTVMQGNFVEQDTVYLSVFDGDGDVLFVDGPYSFGEDSSPQASGITFSGVTIGQ